jgi:hypothetical protein
MNELPDLLKMAAAALLGSGFGGGSSLAYFRGKLKGYLKKDDFHQMCNERHADMQDKIMDIHGMMREVHGYLKAKNGGKL